MQIVLTPPGFIAAARSNNAAVTTQGTNKVMIFTTPEGQKYTGTLNAMSLLTKITTTNPAKNNAPVEVTFAMYKTFTGVRFPSHIVQTERGEPVLDLTVTDVKPNQAVAIILPANVQPAPPALRGN
jgi:hypothetical protein